jgi:hypothetical protein
MYFVQHLFSGDSGMKNKLLKSVFFTMMCFITLTSFNAVAFSQTVRPAPDLSVAGIRLGDEESAKIILQNYSPRYNNDLQRPMYFFYNGYGNQVMSVTAYSREHPFLVVAIEVVAVGDSYQKKHFQMKEVKSFMTDSGFFIGERPSVTSMMFAIPNVTAPKDVIKKKGEPDADEKTEKERTLRYQFNGGAEGLNARETNLKSVNFASYKAEYHFVKNRLRRFRIAADVATP